MLIFFLVIKEYKKIIETTIKATANKTDPINTEPIRTKGKNAAKRILYCFLNSGIPLIFICDVLT